jgi:hypothetical protein
MLIIAVLCFTIAALGTQPPRGNLVAAGLAFWALSALF